MERQINSNLRYFTDDGCGGELSPTDDVTTQLHDKHPKAKPAKLGKLQFGPDEEVHESAWADSSKSVLSRWIRVTVKSDQ